ncbi:MAG: MmgE/PrpD family protein [Betaproteobacteria bacterium]|nr:MmgE/PrpD family protein [Betaproteobacteria bacterium]
MSIASDLARFVTSTAAGDLPPLTFERAKMSLASTIASAAMGFNIPSTRAIRSIEKENAGAAQATIWFDGGKLPVASAARLNAVASDAAASDDSDMRSIAHIGTIVSTASIAMAEKLGRTGEDVLCAMVLGYEVAGRIDEALTPGRMQRGFHGSVSTVFGAAVATGKLLELSATQMTHAIALAATSIGGLAIAADTSCAREYHAGLSAMLGTHAALAASRGYTSEENALEAPRGFFQALGGQAIEEVSAGLGDSWDIVTDMAIKLMPGGHPFHAIAEAALNAAIAGNVEPGEVEKITISAAQLRDWGAKSHPGNLIDAAHSVVYFVAAAVADRRFDWEHMTEAKMSDPVITALQDKVVFDPNPAPLPDRFTHHHGGTVTIRTRSGASFTHTCKAPRGSGSRGIEWEDVDGKYRRLVILSALEGSKVAASLEMIHGFEQLGAVAEFTHLLQFDRTGA